MHNIKSHQILAKNGSFTASICGENCSDLSVVARIDLREIREKYLQKQNNANA